jgi:hypothetical protein
VKWKLWTRNDIIGKGFDEFASKDAALERAREIIRQLHVKVLYIEEPDGNIVETPMMSNRHNDDGSTGKCIG